MMISIATRWRNVIATVLVLFGTALQADDADPAAAPEDPFAKQRFQPPADLVRLAKDHDIWLDVKRKQVVMDGEVTLREGQLEMFACPRLTKEHESVIAVNCKAREAHAGLVAVGAIPGRPAQFDPKYEPASGTVIDIVILWYDKDGKRKRARAQDWVRNVKTGKAMKYDWVFAGSGFWTDPDNGERFYHGDAGDFICVSNFPSATLDVPVESSQANSSLLYESFTDHIPEKGTPVRLVLTPRLKKAGKEETKSKANTATENADPKKPDEKKPDEKKPATEKSDSEKPATKKPGDAQ